MDGSSHSQRALEWATNERRSVIRHAHRAHRVPGRRGLLRRHRQLPDDAALTEQAAKRPRRKRKRCSPASPTIVLSIAASRTLIHSAERIHHLRDPFFCVTSRVEQLGQGQQLVQVWGRYHAGDYLLDVTIRNGQLGVLLVILQCGAKATGSHVCSRPCQYRTANTRGTTVKIILSGRGWTATPLLVRARNPSPAEEYHCGHPLPVSRELDRIAAARIDRRAHCGDKDAMSLEPPVHIGGRRHGETPDRRLPRLFPPCPAAVPGWWAAAGSRCNRCPRRPCGTRRRRGSRKACGRGRRCC